MIILRFLGGLGNQLFIYAFGRALEINYNLEIYFDTLSGFRKDFYKRKFVLDKFNTVIRKISFYSSFYFPLKKRLNKISNILYPDSILIKEDDCFSINKILNENKNYKKIYLEGYFQQPGYFENIKDILRKEITLKKELSDTTKKYLNEIENSNSVAVHVRRNDIKELVPTEFYFKEIKVLQSRIENPIFFIFSDDIIWCIKNFPKEDKFVFIDKTENHIEDFWLMKNCKHFIIGNSTFSWWASWLSEYKNKKIITYKY